MMPQSKGLYPERAIVVSYHVCENLRDITTGDDILQFPGFIHQLQMIRLELSCPGLQHTRRKPKIIHPMNSHFPNIRRDIEAIILMLTVVQDLVKPC
jgi:hypothetical protein